MKNFKFILLVIIGLLVTYVFYNLNEDFGTIFFCIFIAYIFYLWKKRKKILDQEKVFKEQFQKSLIETTIKNISNENVKNTNCVTHTNLKESGIYKHNLKDRQNKYNYISKPVKDYVVIDTETTGRSAQMDHIVEISAIRIRNEHIVDKFQSLVNPNVKIPKSAIKVHGITDDMVVTAPQIQQVLPEFIRFIGDDMLLGHNITFDLRFINSYLDNNIDNKLIDTMLISRNKLPNLPNHKLITLIQYFKLGQSQEHRSLSDCIYTYQVYEMLKEI